MAKNMIACFWTVEELDFSNDAVEFQKLDKETQHFIKQILAFFSTADGIVVENLGGKFLRRGAISRNAILLRLSGIQ